MRHRKPAPMRDEQLANLLASAGFSKAPTSDQLRALSGRILAAAAPVLDSRAAGSRSAWDYAERWSGALIRLGALSAIAAGLCFFLLSHEREAEVRRPAAGARVALLGAATYDVSSQHLVDLVVSTDDASATVRRTGAQ
jgi:hypothetical protein